MHLGRQNKIMFSKLHESVKEFRSGTDIKEYKKDIFISQKFHPHESVVTGSEMAAGKEADMLGILEKKTFKIITTGEVFKNVSVFEEGLYLYWNQLWSAR